MSYQFTTQEQQQLNAARAQCPAGDGTPTSAGNWVPFYTALSSILGARIGDGTVSGADLQDMRNAKLWLDVAIGANGATGMHSAFIRAYTNRQGELRLGGPFTEPQMQLASNGVALNLWKDLSGVARQPPWQLPSIAEIASRDAASIGVYLFSGRLAEGDTAISANAAWSGALGFNLLGGSPPYESWRLLNGGDTLNDRNSALNTLDDVKNILFAVDSYEKALIAGAANSFTDLSAWHAQFNIAVSSGVLFATRDAVAARTPAVGSVVKTISDVSPHRFLDMLMGAVQGRSLIGTTTESNFGTTARAFFGELSPAQLEALHVEMLPTSASGLAARAAEDVNARAALAALSVVSVQVSNEVAARFALYDPTTGQGNITIQWIADRAAMVDTLLLAARQAGTSATDPSLSDVWIYDDRASSLVLERQPGGPGGGRPLHSVTFGGDSGDSIVGAASSDRLYGGAGNDTLSGEGNSDYLEGNIGDDTLYGGDGSDTLAGGQGTDTYAFSGALGRDVVIDADGTGSLQWNAGALPQGLKVFDGLWQSANRQVTYTLVRNVPGADSIERHDLVISFAGGANRIVIRGWNESSRNLGITFGGDFPLPNTTQNFIGDFKKKLALDAQGNTTQYYEIVDGNYVNDGVQAGAADQITGTAGNEAFYGLGGDDAILGREGDDLIFGGDGNDVLQGGLGNDRILGGDGIDVIYGSSPGILPNPTRTDFTPPAPTRPLVFGRGFNWVQDGYLDGNGIYQGYLSNGLRRDDGEGDVDNAVDAGEGNDFVLAGQANDIVQAGAGWDYIEGMAGNDVLAGGDGNDYLTGDGPVEDQGDFLVNNASGVQHGADILIGDSGNDTLLGQGNDDILFGGADADRLYGDDWLTADTPAEFHGSDLIFGGSGNDALIGGGKGDELHGEAGDDYLWGDSGRADAGSASYFDPSYHGADTLYGEAGNDGLFGEGGADLLFGGDGADLLEGDDGNDTLDGGVGDDILRGGEGADLLIGGGGADQMFGGAGNDTLQGGSGSVLVGGAGADTYLVSAADIAAGSVLAIEDTADGNTLQIDGTVALQSVANDGVLRLLVGNPAEGRVLQVYGGFSGSIENLQIDGQATAARAWIAGNVTQALSLQGLAAGGPLYGGAGNDTLAGIDGQDSIYGAGGDDSLAGMGGADTLFGEAGNDWLQGDAVVEQVPAALHGADLLDGGDGNDTLVGLGGDDTLIGGAGNDWLSGEDQTTLFASSNLQGNDSLDGGAGNDTLLGGNGVDVLRGGDGSDALYGGAGDDTLDGGAGDDLLTGDAGNNVFVFGRGYGQDRINLGASSNRIQILEGVAPADITLTQVYEALSGQNTALRIGIAGTNDSITVPAVFPSSGNPNPQATVQELMFADGTRWSMGQVLTQLFSGTSGNDTLSGTAAAETINGAAGDDLLYGQAGDVLNGGDGNDFLIGAGVTVAGGAGNDIVDGSAGNIVMFGRGDGVDRVGTGTGPAVLRLGPAITPDQIQLRQVIQPILGSARALQNYYTTRTGLLGDPYIGDFNLNSLEVSINDTGDRITLDGYYFVVDPRWKSGVNRIEFADGTVWNSASIQQALFQGSSQNDTLDGTAANDQISGAAGNDRLDGLAGADTLNGGSGNDTLIGVDQRTWSDDGSSDTLAGGAGDDFYHVSAEGLQDVIVEHAGEGFDTVYIIGTASQSFQQSFQLGANLEGLEFSASFNGTSFVGTGNALGNRLLGSLNNDTLNGLGGDDTLEGAGGSNSLVGGTGNDVYIVENVVNPNAPSLNKTDTVIEQPNEGSDTVISRSDWTLGDNIENLQLAGVANLNGTGNTAANQVTGNAGNNRIDGALGADTMAGGAGNDTYVVDDIGDIVIESIGQGTDIVQASASHTLSANVENLTLMGAAAINGTGNDGANALTGNSAANTLDGGLGNDTLVGGAGDDTYVVDGTGDVVTEQASAGTDTIISAVTVTLGTNIENLTLAGTSPISGTGNSAANVLRGNTASNVLDGGAGADTMIGGAGDDRYVVNSTGDVVTENPGEGTDAVESSVTFTIANDIENLTLTGSSAINGTGNALANQLQGNSGSNVLDGGAGADTMIGGAGNDTYAVDNIADVVTELAAQGTDLVNSSVSYTLGAELENLTLTGASAINGTGNGLANTLTGNAAANWLDGGLGNDTMAGGAGDDSYVVDSASDVTTEATGAGTDLVLSSLNWTLATNLENLTLTGIGNLSGTGNASANTLRGNAGNNALNGAAGNDTMIGGAGDDSYTVDSTGDVITELAAEGTDSVSSGVTYTLAANVENLTLTGTTAINGTGNTLNNRLTGNSANNNLSGGAGNDTIDGGAGNDTMVGGAGDDTYVVNVATDVVTEAANEGTDTVQSAVTLTLGNNVENLTLTGTTAINGTGNTLNNVLTGNGAANTLAGAAGNDTYIGGAGNDILNDNSTTSNDTYRWGVGQGNDSITDAGGSDRIEIAAGVTASQVSLVRSGNNLQVRISGATDVLSVVNWYTATANRVETIALADGTVINAGTVAPLSVVAPASRESMAMRVRGPVDATRATAWATNLDGDRGARLLVEAMAQFDGRTTGSETIERVRRPDLLRIDLASPM